MKWPTLQTYDRLDPDDGLPIIGNFERSYLGIRIVIGTLGLALPIALALFDAFFLKAEAEVRGSMSAYYHSSVRDLFVGGLWASGVILCSYLFWKWSTWDFWLSLFAGIAVIGVATFPTGRAGVQDSPTSCGEDQALGTPPCVAIQERFGEGPIEMLHQTSAGLVVAAFALLCLVFALRDFGYGVAAHKNPGDLGVRRVWRSVKGGGLVSHLFRKAPRTVLYLACVAGVLIGAIWALFGPDWPAPQVYMGEFIAFSSFGAAWMVASWDLLERTRVVKIAKEKLGSLEVPVGRARAERPHG